MIQWKYSAFYAAVLFTQCPDAGKMHTPPELCLRRKLRPRLITFLKGIVLFMLICRVSYAQEVKIGGLKKTDILFGLVKVSASEKYVAAKPYYGNELYILETFSGNEIQRLTTEFQVSAMFFLSDTFLLRFFARKMEVVNFHKDSVVFSQETDNYINKHAYDEQSKILAVTTAAEILLYDLAKGLPALVNKIEVQGVKDISISGGGNFVAGIKDSTLKCWKVSDGTLAGSAIPAGNLLSFQAGSTSIVTLLKEPFAYQYFGFDGKPINKPIIISSIPRPYSTTIQVIDNDFCFTTYGRTVFTYASGYQEVLKTDLASHRAIWLPESGQVLTWNVNRIEITDDEGSLFSSSITQQINPVNLFYSEDLETIYLVGDSAVNIAKGDKLVKKIPLGAAVVSETIQASNVIIILLANRKIKIFDKEKQAVIAEFSHPVIPSKLSYDPAAQTLYFTDLTSNTIYCYRLKSAEKKAIYTQEKIITSLCLLPGGKIAIGDEAGSVKILEKSATGNFAATQENNFFSSQVSALKSTNDGLLAGAYGRFAFIPVSNLKEANSRIFIGHNSFISSFELNASGNLLYTTSEDRSVKLWDTKSTRLLASYTLDSGNANRVHIIDDTYSLFFGKDIAIGEVRDSTAPFIGKSYTSQLLVQAPNNNAPLKMAINVQGTLLASIDGNTIKIRDIKSGFLINEFTTRNKIVNGLTFSADGSMLAVASAEYIECFDPYKGIVIRNIDLSRNGRAGTFADGTPTIFKRSFHDIEAYNNAFIAFNVFGWHNPLVIHKNSGLKIAEIYFNPTDDFDNQLIDLKCTSDGSLIATMGNKYVKIFSNKDSFKLLYTYPRTSAGKIIKNYSDYMSFSPEGKYLLMTDVEKTEMVKIVDIATGKIIREHPGGIGAMGNNGQYLYSNTKETLFMANVANEEKLALDQKCDLRINNVQFNAKNNFFAVSDIWGNIKVIDARSKKSISEINRWDQYTYQAKLSPDQQYLVMNNRWGLFTIDLNSLKREELPADNFPFSAVCSPDGKKIYFRKGTTIWEKTIATGVLDSVYNKDELMDDFSGMMMGSDGKTLAVILSTNDISLIDIKTKREVFSFNRFKIKEGSGFVISDVTAPDDRLQLKGIWINTYGESSGMVHALVSADGKFTLAPLTKEVILKRESSSGFTKEVFKMDGKVFELSPSGKYLAFMKELELYIVDTKNNDTLFNRDNSFVGNIVKVLFDKDERLFIVATDDGYIEVYDLMQKTRYDRFAGDYSGFKQLSSFKANEMGIRDMQLEKDLLLVTGSNSFLSLFRVDKRLEKTIDMVIIKDDDQLFIDPKGYYYSSKGALDYVAYKRDTTIFSLDATDFKFNRPDLVLKSARSNNTSLIEGYRNAYLKRISRQQIDTTLQADYNLIPGCRLKNISEIAYDQPQQKLTLKLELVDATASLEALNIWINKIPLFGQHGLRLAANGRKKMDTAITVTLSTGVNAIEYAVRNKNKLESPRTPLYVMYNPANPLPEKIHFMGIGIDQFSDSQYNLQYSTKDIRDLSLKLKSKFGNSIVIDTLFNEKVTVGNIKALKKKLLQTGVNDKVIVSYSGHGLLSKGYDYYLSTYSVNFNKPEENGLLYDELENLLDSIPARKKLLLIDACHSGEVDKEEGVAINKTADALGLTKGIIIDQPPPQQKQVGLKNSFELMQSLFVNVGKSTGATIISAAAGNQFALERGDLKNGVFTYSILEAMNKYPTIRISELKKIVGERVEQLTNGLQKPTSRNETIAVDWSLW
jgi:WD40 repeat protein